MRTVYFILGALLLLAGILTAVFPIGIFAVIQYLAAARCNRDRDLSFYYICVYDLLFQRLYADHIRYTECTDWYYAAYYADPADRQVVTFMLAFLLIFNGAEKLSFASRLRYYRIPHAGALTFSGVLNIILAGSISAAALRLGAGAELYSVRLPGNHGNRSPD